jgi:hypothetical protein
MRALVFEIKIQVTHPCVSTEPRHRGLGMGLSPSSHCLALTNRWCAQLLAF